MYIDTHSHIYAEEFDDDREEAVERAFEAGVEGLVLPDIDRGSRPRMLEAAERHPGRLFPTLGVHPTSVDGSWREEMAAFEKWLGRTEIVAIGECGIDLHWDTTYYKEQRAVFERQLRVAGEMDLPVIIHSRDSLPEIFAALERLHGDVRGVLHCFPGTAEDAERAADLGFLLGVGGVVTFTITLPMSSSGSNPVFVVFIIHDSATTAQASSPTAIHRLRIKNSTLPK